ncbi:hypothetical protein ACTXT7_000429 [Hymenolepis weldensis]
MKRHAVIVSIQVKLRNLETVRFLKVVTSFVGKVEKELLNINNGYELTATRNRKQHCQRPADLVTTPVCQMSAWHDGRKSWKVNARHPVRDLQVSEGTIRNVLYQDLGYKVHTFFGESLRVNADADACEETLQTIVVKPPWIDSVANGGGPYIFQQDSAPSHKALKKL